MYYLKSKALQELLVPFAGAQRAVLGALQQHLGKAKPAAMGEIEIFH